MVAPLPSKKRNRRFVVGLNGGSFLGMLEVGNPHGWGGAGAEYVLASDHEAVIERLTRDPEDDLYSDAMDRAISAYHSVRHGAMRNAEKAGEIIDGEKLARRALAAGFRAYLEEIVAL